MQWPPYDEPAMDRKYIDENHIIPRYLADQLSAEECQAFETYYLDHPEILSELEATSRLKAGLMKFRDSGELEALIAQPATPSQRWQQWRYTGAIAAALIALAIGLVFFVRSTSTERIIASSVAALRDASGQPLAIGATHTLIRTRGDADVLVLMLPAPAQAIELRVLPAFKAGPDGYQVALSRVDGGSSSPFEIDGVQPADDEFIAIYLDSARLSAGRYKLAVSAAGTAADTFTLVVRDERN
jgi:hypothetical protein